jgi:uridine kinase
LNTLVIGIAGGSGSGKTTLTRRLVEEFGDYITVMSHDDYYRSHDELTLRSARA